MSQSVAQYPMEKWCFHLGDQPEAWQRGFDDSEWETVRAPHDWAVRQPFDEKNSSGVGYLPGGIGWYRTRFTLVGTQNDGRVFLHFDGVYKNSQVWINGYYLGKRPNGYIGFEYDVTDFVRYGDDDNQVSVKVSHEDAADSRWYTGSGITRKAFVAVRPIAHILNDQIHMSYDINNGHADINVTFTACNYSTNPERPEKLTLMLDDLEISPAGGIELQPGSMEYTLSISVPDVRLWSVDNPQLYTLSASDGTAIRVGFRDAVFDPDKGFSLNGQSMKIKGVCVHHDAGCLGAAVYPEVWKRRLTKLKAMGCNAIRTSHNPHMPELYNLCDEMGFLVMDECFDEWEAPKNKWVHGHNVYPPSHQGYYEDFPEWGERDLADMVKRDRNHPSVIMWSIGNEIDYPNDPYVHPLFETMTGNNDSNKPSREREYNPDKPNAERLTVIAKRLADVVRKHDTTRPVLFASAFPELSTQIGMFDHMDILAYNYKEEFYDADHVRFPNKPVLGSENSHKPEAWQAVVDRDFVCGQFLWTGIDFLGETRGWPVHGSMAGVLTTAGFEKQRYYERAALWVDKQSIQQPAPSEPITALIWSKTDRLKQIEVTLATDALVEVSITGGELLGIDNGDLSDNTPFTEMRRRTYEGRLVVYALAVESDAKLTLISEGLSPMVVELVE